MVKITKRPKVPGGIGGFIACVVGTLLVIGFATFGGGGSSGALQADSLAMVNRKLDVESNSQTLKEWRHNLRKLCTAATSVKEVSAMTKKNLQGFSLPQVRVPQPRGDQAVKRCHNVVMDFGANVGDTSGHVIDTGLIGCKREDLGKEAKTPESHFNIETKQFEHVPKRNMLTQNMEKLMEEVGKGKSGPEDYCYYGIEGNPHFTDRLQKIEDFVMAIRPRPIQHMHFFTESVGAGEDGMTKLYLDTVNTEQNFWGSSIFKDHQDVRKSAEQAGKSADVIAAPVMGYTIGALMRKTLTAFDPNAADSQKKGNHLILKVDIEGGEYPLLHQAVEEGTLCEFVKLGNTADLFIEFHSQRVTGKHDFAGKTKQMKEHLTACGVTFRNLAAWWA